MKHPFGRRVHCNRAEQTCLVFLFPYFKLAWKIGRNFLAQKRVETAFRWAEDFHPSYAADSFNSFGFCFKRSVFFGLVLVLVSSPGNLHEYFEGASELCLFGDSQKQKGGMLEVEKFLCVFHHLNVNFMYALLFKACGFKQESPKLHIQSFTIYNPIISHVCLLPSLSLRSSL